MSELQSLIQQIPTSQIAAHIGESPEETQRAINTLIPTLLSGLEANAQDPAGERSILEALEQHDPALVEGGVDPNQIDTADGDKIASHVFGPHRDQVIERLSLNGAGSSGLLQKLLPILAPIVLSFLMQQLQKKMGGGAAPREPQGGGAQGGGLGDILGQILGGGMGGAEAPAPAPEPSAPQTGGIGDILGQILGGGFGGDAAPEQPTEPAEAPAPAPRQQQAPSGERPTRPVLPGPNDVRRDRDVNPSGDAESRQSGGGIGDILGGVLGDLLGGGRR